ncbi:MAG: hypothetical protein ACFCUJ_11160 [Thiotrichales bacterium]
MGTTLKIGLWGTDNRFRRMLSLYLSRKTGDAFVVSDLADADIAVVDLDGFNADQQWKAFRAQYGHVPALVLSVEERQLPEASCVLKPVQGDELLRALRRLESRALKQRRVATPNVTATTGPRPAPIGTALHAARLLGAHEIARLQPSLRADDGNNGSTRDDPAAYYDPSEYLQGVVDRALSKARSASGAIVIRGLGQDIEFSEGGELVRTTLNEAQLCALCHVRFDQSFTPYLIAARDAPLPTGSAGVEQPIDAFRWKVALWSARGRLATGTHTDRSVRLRRWPNLTRWTRLKFDMQLAALWFEFGFSPQGISERFAIPRRYVYSFHSACSALGLFEPCDESHDRKPLREVRPSAEKQGFMSRLLSFLGGKRRT